MSLSQLAEEYRESGFVHLRSMIDRETVAHLADAVESSPERYPEPNPLSSGAMLFRSNLFYGSDILQDFLTSPRVIELVTALRGPDLWVRWDQAVWKGAGAPEFPWHQDNGYTGLEVEHLQLWVALTRMCEDNGGLMVCPSAHRERLPHRWVGGYVETTPPGPIVSIRAAPGDVVAFSSYLPHATRANETRETRLAYVAEFLPLSAVDPSVPPPHLIASRGSRPETGRRLRG